MTVADAADGEWKGLGGFRRRLAMARQARRRFALARQGRGGVADCKYCPGRRFLPVLRASRHLPEPAPARAYVSHADDSTIGSNFCQARIVKK
jgi:hypothetical protein